jgi:hypothetical protein
MSVLEQRGVFWWHDEAIAEGSEALSVLYHALLLHEAGIDAQILKRCGDGRSFASRPAVGSLADSDLGAAARRRPHSAFRSIAVFSMPRRSIATRCSPPASGPQ